MSRRQSCRAVSPRFRQYSGRVSGSRLQQPGILASKLLSYHGLRLLVRFHCTINLDDFDHDEILHQCDGLDGVIDGIIEDPGLCDFCPKALLCTNSTTTHCLTLGQVSKVRETFSPLSGEDGRLIYPAMQPGSEVLAVQKLYAGRPFSNSEVMTNSSLLCFAADVNNNRIGSDTLSTTIQRGMLLLSPSTTLPWPTHSTLRTAGHGRTTFPHSVIHAARSSASTAVKTIKSQVSIPNDFTIAFHAT